MSAIQSRAFSPRGLGRRVSATARHLTGLNLAIIAFGSCLAAFVASLLATVVSTILGYASDAPVRIAAGLSMIIAASVAVIWIGGREERNEEREAAELRQPDSQAARIADALSQVQGAGDRIARTLADATATIQKALDSTTGIVDALQEELRASRTAIDGYIAEADQARARAVIELESAKAIDTQLDRRLEVRLTAQERKDTAGTCESPLGISVSALCSASSPRS